MSCTPQILIHNLAFSTPDGKKLFEELSLQLSSKKTGLVGRNGVGKTIFLQLITGELKPDAGSIQVIGTVGYCAQEPVEQQHKTIAEVLSVQTKLNALERILKGSILEEDFIILDDDWTIQDRTKTQLTRFGLGHLALDRPITHLSGGEKMRLLLAKTFLANPDFIILDEPTNNLDNPSREYLYAAIREWRGGLLVVSHDQSLLNIMNEILELTTIGMHCYGGNFDYYATQKEIKEMAHKAHLLAAEEMLKKAKNSVQNTLENHEKRRSIGKKLRHSGSQCTLVLNAMKERSSRTQGVHSIRKAKMLNTKIEKLNVIKQGIEITQELSISMLETLVPNGKRILEIEDLFFAYTKESPPIIQHFNLTLCGPERICLMGPNGSGKTTLVKLILGELMPIAGNLKVGVDRINYFDQTLEILQPEKSILENFLNLNPNSTEMEARFSLASFLFRGDRALKKVNILSGGEKLRAALACVLLSEKPPQLLILDEPTNHLDFESMKAVGSALNQYQGALMIISHDSNFTKHLGITTYLKAPYI